MLSAGCKAAGATFSAAKRAFHPCGDIRLEKEMLEGKLKAARSAVTTAEEKADVLSRKLDAATVTSAAATEALKASADTIEARVGALTMQQDHIYLKFKAAEEALRAQSTEGRARSQRSQKAMTSLETSVADEKLNVRKLEAALVAAKEAGRTTLAEMVSEHSGELRLKNVAAAEVQDELRRVRDEAAGLLAEKAEADGELRRRLLEVEAQLAGALEEVRVRVVVK